MQIKREFYLQQLIDGKQNGLIKIVTGIRRCGKSYLLFKLFRQHLLQTGVDPEHIIQIALDDIENENLRDPHTLYKYIKEKMTDDELYYILLDEVQLVPRFEDVLNSLLRIDNADVYVTGSNSKFLSSATLSPNFVVVVMKFAFFLFLYLNIVKAQVCHLLKHGQTTTLMEDFLMFSHLPLRRRNLII